MKPIEKLWEEAIASKVRRGMSRKAAVKQLVTERPDLHAAYLAEANATRPHALRELGA